MNYYAVFALTDFKNIRRDSLLAFMLAVPWLLVVVFRLVLPPVRNWLAATYQIALEPYYPLILSMLIILQLPFLFGVVYGFLILDEKDEHILMALQVTPVTISGYVRYRITAALIFSLVYVMLILAATGMADLPQLAAFSPAVFLGGLLSVLLMLFLIVFAGNKVEGLALMKGMGILMMGPLAAFFMESKWQILLGILPSYWPAKVFWLISDGKAVWGYVTVGAAYISLLIFILYRRFEKKLSKL